jgi:GntR family transcriptional repressor for pyruvate dehydrogenase complex
MTALTEKPNQGSAHVLNSIWSVVQERGLKVGDQLPSIRELSDRLEVKRTVVRDALLKAESLGMVKVMPRAGAFLRTPVSSSSEISPSAESPLPHVFHQTLLRDEHNLFHLLDSRRLIEVELAGRAAEHRRLEDLLPVRRALEALLHLPLDAPRADYVDCDIRFHIEIARQSGNQVLFAFQQTLMELLRPHLNDVHQDLQRRATTDRSHIAIYEALVASDAERARNEMREHLSLAYDSMLRDIQELPALEGDSTNNRLAHLA